MTDLGQLQANWWVALGQKRRVGARKKSGISNSSSDYYAPHDGRKEATNMIIGTSSSALRKGLVAWVQGQTAPAWVQQPSNMLLKQKPPDNVTRGHQSVCADVHFCFQDFTPKFSCSEDCCPRLCLSHRMDAFRSLGLGAQPCPYYVLLSGWKELLTKLAGFRFWCSTYHCKCWIWLSTGLQIPRWQSRTYKMPLTSPMCQNPSLALAPTT